MKLLIALAVVAGCVAASDVTTQRAATSLTSAPAGGWSWFGDPRAVFHDGVTYFGYITGAGDVTIAAYDHASETLTSTVLRAGFEVDDHNNPSILIRESDKRIMVFYSAHNGGGMFLRVSIDPEDISAFADEVDLDSQLGGTFYTYPNPIQLTGEQDSPIYLFYRDRPLAVGELNYSVSTDGGASWSAGTFLFSAPARSAYWKVASDGVSRIDFGVSDGHPLYNDQVSIHHFYYEGGDFHASDGTVIAAALPLEPADLTEVYDGTVIESWVWDIAKEPSFGHPRITFASFPTTGDHRYHYAAWDGVAWNVSEIVGGGAYIYSTDAEPYYSGGVVLDHNDPNVVYASVHIDGQLEIVRYVTSDDGEAFRATNITTGSTVKNIRPFVPRNHDGRLSVLWMRGTYTTYTNWNTGTWGLLTTDTTVSESLEAWVTEPDGTYIAHLDRSEESPFRGFWFGPARNQPGTGILDYHPDNQILRDHPTLFDPDNLVHMRFRGYDFVWIVEDETAVLDEREHETEWRKVSGRGTLQLLGHRIVLPTDFDGTTADGRNPKTWASQWRTFTNRAAGEMLWDLISETND